MDPALWELLRGSTDDREVEAIVRLDRPQVGVAGVRIVSRFGRIATCRLRKDSILDVRRDENVVSLKAARALGPEYLQEDGDTAWERRRHDGDRRRPPGLRLTGAGVTVGFVDWGCDVDHPNFKRRDGSTRLRALWDQRGPAARGAPQPYGYGVLHHRGQINRALRTLDPYAALGYHPADADRDGFGAHGSHVMDIAAGNGLAGGPIGIAPEADLVFVHLAERGTSGLANLGDSVRILEAVDFIARTAGHRPWVINISVGRHGGPHDGCTLAELALDAVLRAAPGRFIVQSAGNYFASRTHASGRLEQGQLRSLTMVTHEADVTPNELEVWYGGEDELVVRVVSPTGRQTDWVRLGETVDVVEDDLVVGRIYHRDRDPNNHDNHVELFLYPWAPAGPWDVDLQAVRIRDGVFHAWLERDEACVECQARFVEGDVDRACTTGTIAHAHFPLVVGAYAAHAPDRQLARFSSAGPTRDGRFKPDLVAPGVGVLAARSAPQGSANSPGLLTRKSGTSMAAPHVTGAVALCLEGAPGPLTAEEIRALLLETAQPLTTAAEPRSRSGCGYLDLAGAVRAVSALGRPANRRPSRPDAKERQMQTDGDEGRALPVGVSPDTLYRELVAGRDGPVSAWVHARFDVLARPGEAPPTQPEAEDVLVRVALGEPGLGHVAVLCGSGLLPHNALDRAGITAEHGGPGLYATVIEGGAFPHSRSDRFARRVLDRAGRMPAGQLLLRPRPLLEVGVGLDQPGFNPLANDRGAGSILSTGLEDPVTPAVEELTGEGSPGLAIPVETRRAERCKAEWLKKVAKLPPDVREVLELTGASDWSWALERVQRAIDLGVRGVNLLTNFAYFAVYGEQRGYCPIPRGHPDASDWRELHKEVTARLSAPAKPLEQGGPVGCVGRRENRIAAPEPEQAPADLTGRYEYTITDPGPAGTLALNQAGRHVEFSIAPFAQPGAAGERPVKFYAGDVDAQGSSFLAVNKEQANERLLLRARGTELELASVDSGAPFAMARRVQARSTLFPVAVRSISRSLDRPGGAVGQVIDIGKELLSTAFAGPFLYRQEHLPLSRDQVAFLRKRFASTEFAELVRRAAAATGHRSADAAVRERLRDEIQRFVDRTVNDRRGVHRSDLLLARAFVLRILSRGGFSDGNRVQSYLDWIQQIAQLTNSPVGADSVLGIRPSEGKVDAYVYDVKLNVAEAAFILGGGVGEMSVRQVAPTAWPEPIKLRVWFGSIGASVNISTDSFSGQATSPLPWAQGDFVGRIERVKGAVEGGFPGISGELSAGFLHIYGSELLPPLTVLEADKSVSAAVEFEPEGRGDQRKWKLGKGFDVGVTGLIGHASATQKLEVLDLTQSDPEPIYAVRGGGRRDVHFCFDSALLTPAARQMVRIVSALWRPFLTSPHSRISTVGYADKAGDQAYNLQLSQHRADNTLTAFRDVLGGAFAAQVEPPKGMGEAGAAAGGPRAGAPYRRVEVQLDGLTVLVLNGE